MLVWRICRARYASEAFSGDGARRFGGRWNSRSVPMVYTSSSLALSALELFVHLDPSEAPADLVSISAELPEGEPEITLDAGRLPPEWWTEEAAVRDLGDEWIRAQTSLAMRVPSVPIRSEWNVLINPTHPRMTELKIEPAEPFVFDARMFQR